MPHLDNKKPPDFRWFFVYVIEYLKSNDSWRVITPLPEP